MISTCHSVCMGKGDKGTVKPVLSGDSKIDRTKVLDINGSLMKVDGIAE